MDRQETDYAKQYFPRIYFDRKEPFDVKLVGCYIYRESGPSLTFNRTVTVDKEKYSCVIEYGIFYDYDIQHMYDLEHIWIYVGKDGNVADAECSSHGRVLNCFRYRSAAEGGKRITLYSQPGKHAFFPEGNLFLLFPDYITACGSQAGRDGLLIPDQLSHRFTKNEKTDRYIEALIQREFSFLPTLEFEEREIADQVFIPEEGLFDAIADRIAALLEELGI